MKTKKVTRTKRILPIGLLSLFIMFLYAFSLAAFAAAQYDSSPVPPAFYYGNAAVNGREVPVNSFIIAKIDGVGKGTIKVTVAGKYGEEASQTKLYASGSQSDTGKTMEFYLKMPGYKEIKAAQNSAWYPGTNNALDLTFNGEELVEDTSLDEEQKREAEAAAGGEMSVGGFFDETAEEPNEFGLFYYEFIDAGSQFSLALSSKNLPIIRLQMILNNRSENVNFDFKVVEMLAGAPELENVYNYLIIDAKGIDDSNIKTAILRFRVPNSWFNGIYDPEKVRLQRFSDGKWGELETVYEGGDSEYSYYRAETPGFSYFAINSEKTQELIEKKSMGGIKNDASGSAQNSEAGDNSNDSGIAGKLSNRMTANAIRGNLQGNPFVAGAAIVLLMISVFLLYYRNK